MIASRDSKMTPALATLLERSLDYAGLFPPAALDLPGAVAHYRRHLVEDRIGMLASFVCPASKLAALAQETTGASWRLSILATGGETSEAALQALEVDLRSVARLLDLQRGFEPATLEIRIPGALSGDPAGIESFVRAVETKVASSGWGPGRVFYEIGWEKEWREALPILRQLTETHKRGVKVRTGGLIAAAFPSSEQIAAFLGAACDAGIPFKATAGLHHPVRRFQDEVETKMHGFLNLFCAAGMAYAGEDERTLVAMLNEEDAKQFGFTSEAMTWRGHELDREWLARTRAEFALSFGSCSYNEPVEDLKALGLL